MPAPILAKCPCGRTLRAREDQIGATVRCWDCGGEVPVSPPAERSYIGEPMFRALRDSVRAPAVGLAAAGAGVLTLALFVPGAGGWVALAAAASLVAWWYGGLVRRAGLGDPAAAPAVAPGRLARVGRFALGAVWAAALVAPLLARNGGHVLPARGATGSVRAMTAPAVLGWVVMPLVLAAVYAHDRRGPLSPRRALAAVPRHPWATLAALLVPPLGLAAMEGLLVCAALQQSCLPLMVADLFPVPEMVTRQNGTQLIYRYDHLTIERPYTEDAGPTYPVYLSGLGRGYTLLGSIPASLTTGAAARFRTELYWWSPEAYVTFRSVLSILILTGVGLLLSVQARWLGLVVSQGKRSVRQRPAPVSVPVPVPVPVPVQSAVPAPSRPAAAPPSPFASASRLIPTSGNGVAYAGDAAASGASRLPAAAVAAPPHPGPSRPRVLVIEDETPVAEALARILVARGYGVVLAGDGEEGLRQARAARPDVIVLDLLLPNKSGAEVCRELRADPVTSAIPILIATSADTEADELAGLAVGADDYVAKPYSVDVLIARILKQLQRRKG